MKSHGFLEKSMVELYSTTNPEEKFRIQEAFAQHGIEYKMKVKNYTQPNFFDRAMMGTMGNHHTPRLTTIFYVREEDVEAVLHLIRC